MQDIADSGGLVRFMSEGVFTTLEEHVAEFIPIRSFGPEFLEVGDATAFGPRCPYCVSEVFHRSAVIVVILFENFGVVGGSVVGHRKFEGMMMEGVFSAVADALYVEGKPRKL